MRSFHLLAAIALLSAPARPLLAQLPLHFALDAKHTDIEAKVAFLGLISESARFPSATGHIALDPENLDALQLDVTLDARAVTAPDADTERRLKGQQFFDVAHFPEVRFVGSNLVMTGERTALLSGTITARGVSRPATLDILFAQAPASTPFDQPMRLTASMTINRDDFGMTAFHLIVGRKVKITIDATMDPA